MAENIFFEVGGGRRSCKALETTPPNTLNNLPKSDQYPRSSFILGGCWQCLLLLLGVGVGTFDGSWVTKLE